MKAIGNKCIALVLFGMCALGAMAQNDVTVKVVNVRSAQGKYKLYVFHDENGNYELDREGGVPQENCAVADLEVKADTKSIDVELKDLRF